MCSTKQSSPPALPPNPGTKKARQKAGMVKGLFDYFLQSNDHKH